MYLFALCACLIVVVILMSIVVFFFFKQKTAYEMRISDWSSDVCSSDLRSPASGTPAARRVDHDVDGWRQAFRWPATGRLSGFFGSQRVYQGKPGSYHGDRKSVV